MLRRIIPAALILFAAFISGVNYSEAASALLPPKTEEVKTETRKFGGSWLECTYYLSSLSSEGVKDFYKRSLAKLGSTINDPLKKLSNISDFKVTSELSNMLSNNMVFERDGQTQIINVIPERYFEDRKSRFVICRGKVDYKNYPLSGGAEAILPELKASPKLNIAPLYPSAKLLNMSEDKGSLKAIYVSGDDIKRIEGFYEDKMPGYGWVLKEKKPIRWVGEKSFAGGKEDLSRICPTCPPDSARPANMFYGELTFSNIEGDICGISLSTLSLEGEDLKGMGFTNILVRYEKKK